MRKRTVIFSWILFLGWLGVIFFFSSQTGEESGELSNSFLTFIQSAFHLPLMSSIFSFLVRKLAHFTEYAILGMLSMNLMHQYKLACSSKVILGIWLFCVLYAGSDEFHQSFVGGRSPQVMDVCIDSLGSLTGILGYSFIRKFKKKTS